MTDQDLVHYVMIIDRSGSMQSIKDDTNGGIRDFIDTQLKGVDKNKRTISLFQFDTEHDCVHDFELLEKAKAYKLEPRGGTALLDAIGYAITSVGGKLKDTPEDERPGQVMVVIATDGRENSSREYTKRADIRKMIEHQQDKYGWRFTYIGANQDSFAEAGSLGIPLAGIMDYDMRNARVGWNITATATAEGTAPTSKIFYTNEQREEAVK